MWTRMSLCVALVGTLLGLVAADVGAIAPTRVTVTTAATLIFTASTTSTNRILIRNPSAVSVYLGPATVTTATGFELAAGDALTINLSGGDTVYGIVAAATQVVHVIQGSNP